VPSKASQAKRCGALSKRNSTEIPECFSIHIYGASHLYLIAFRYPIRFCLLGSPRRSFRGWLKSGTVVSKNNYLKLN
jgi:hypothetical protein